MFSWNTTAVNFHVASMMTSKTSGETKEQTTIASRRSQSKRRFVGGFLLDFRHLFQQNLGLDSIFLTFLVTSHVFSWYFQEQSFSWQVFRRGGRGSKSMRQLWQCLQTEWGLKLGVVLFLVVFLKILFLLFLSFQVVFFSFQQCLGD